MNTTTKTTTTTTETSRAMATREMQVTLYNLRRVANSAGRGPLTSEINAANACLTRLESGDSNGPRHAAIQLASFAALMTGGVISYAEALQVIEARYGLPAMAEDDIE